MIAFTLALIFLQNTGIMEKGKILQIKTDTIPQKKRKKIKLFFSNFFIVGITGVLFFAQACQSTGEGRQQQIINDYAKAACDLQKIQSQKDSVSNSTIKPLELQLSELNSEYHHLSSTY